jgi:hypothetical protein
VRTRWQRGVWLTTLVSSLAVGAQTPPGHDASLARLVEVDRQLRSAPRPDPDSWEIPAPLAELHARWIDAFTAWLDGQLNARDPDPRLALSAELRHAVCDLRVTRREPFLVVEVELRMGWACDRLLLVYQVERGRPRRVVRLSALRAREVFEPEWERAPVTDMSDLLSTLAWALGGARDAPFLLVAYHPLQPASNWHTLHWAALDLDGHDTPFTRDHASMLVNGRDPAFRLSAHADGFTLEYTTEQGLDAGRWSRDVRRRFTVERALVTEEGSGATEPLGFVSAWTLAPEERAAAWSTPATLDWRDEVRALVHEVAPEFGRIWVDRCPPDERRWVVELRFDPSPLAEEPVVEPDIDALFFTIARRGRDFRMLEVGPEPLDPGVAVDLASCAEALPKGDR